MSNSLYLYNISKLVLTIFIWGQIALLFFILIKTQKFYLTLKLFEDTCKSIKREFIHRFIPVANIISTSNRNCQMALHPKQYPLKQLLLFLVSLLLSGLSLFQGLKTSFALLNKLLR